MFALNDFDIPARMPKPGKLVKDELEAREITQKEFAKKIKVKESDLSSIINGNKSITVLWAFRLYDGLGISPQTRINLQSNYDLYKFLKNPSNKAWFESVQETKQGLPLQEAICS